MILKTYFWDSSFHSYIKFFEWAILSTVLSSFFNWPFFPQLYQVFGMGPSSFHSYIKFLEWALLSTVISSFWNGPFFFPQLYQVFGMGPFFPQLYQVFGMDPSFHSYIKFLEWALLSTLISLSFSFFLNKKTLGTTIRMVRTNIFCNGLKLLIIRRRS